MVGVSLNVFDVGPVYLYVDRQSYSERLQCGVIAVYHNHDHWQSISITHIIGPCRRNYNAQSRPMYHYLFYVTPMRLAILINAAINNQLFDIQ